MIYPMRDVVAGISTADESDPVLLAGVEVARRTGATLHLVHGISRPDLVWADPTAAAFATEAVEDYSNSVRSRLEERVRALIPEAQGIEIHIDSSSPGRAILALAEKVAADLVVVGPTRHGRVGRILLGTTAQRVLRHAATPVLVVRGALPRPLRRLLLTTDLSDFSPGVHEAGLDIAETLFGGDAPELRTLFVVDYGIGLPVPELEGMLENVTRAQLSNFLSQRRPRGRPISEAIRFGEAAEEIAAEAVEWGADLVIVGKHDEGIPARWLLGSVAEAAIREVRCSVLVVPSAIEEERRLPVTWDEAHPENPRPR